MNFSEPPHGAFSVIAIYQVARLWSCHADALGAGPPLWVTRMEGREATGRAPVWEPHWSLLKLQQNVEVFSAHQEWTFSWAGFAGLAWSQWVQQ